MEQNSRRKLSSLHALDIQRKQHAIPVIRAGKEEHIQQQNAAYQSRDGEGAVFSPHLLK
jgi:hypothetical protein